MELEIENLTKQYGNKMAIQNVSCTLKPGVVGLLGQIELEKVPL